MSERLIVDVGAQYVGTTVRFAVLRTGMDGDGAYAVVSVGSHPNATTVRLRVGVPHTLPDGRLLHLFALAPVGSRPAVAFEITTAGEAGVGSAP